VKKKITAAFERGCEDYHKSLSLKDNPFLTENGKTQWEEGFLKELYRRGVIVFLIHTKQYGIVDRVTQYGVRVQNIGIVPFDELRLADNRESDHYKIYGQQVLKQFEF